MNLDKDHIKRIFASKLKGVEQDPPAFMWERIESGLTTHTHTPPTRKLIYKIAGWSTAAAAAVALGLFLFSPEKPQGTEPSQIAAVEPVIHTEQAKPTEVQDCEPVKEEAKTEKNLILPSLRTNTRVAVQPMLAHAKANIEHNNIQQGQPGDTSFVTKSALAQVTEPDNKAQTTVLQDKGKKGTADPLNKDVQKQIEEFEAQGRKTEALLAENANVDLSGRSNGNFDLGINGGGAFAKADSYKRTVVAMGNADQQLSLRSETVKLEHNQPITFGLTVNKKISNKLSVESGVTYTYLSSRIRTSEASAYNQNNKQYFHYLGIPLTVNYNVLEWNKIRLYIAAGGAVQKDIYGRMDRNRTVNLSGSEKSDKKSISQKNVQMSLTSSVGISYPIYDKMSVYTTVGGAYYPDAKNEYETIYSDKKWLLNLNFGIKFGF